MKARYKALSALALLAALALVGVRYFAPSAKADAAAFSENPALDRRILGRGVNPIQTAAAPAPATITNTNPVNEYDWNLKTSPFLTLGGEATLNFGSKKITFTVEKIDTKGPNSYVVTGRSIDNPNPAKDVIVVYRNGVMLANANTADGFYAIAPISKNTWFVGADNKPLNCGSCPATPAASAPTAAQSVKIPAGYSGLASSPALLSTPNAESDLRTVTTDGPVLDILYYVDQAVLDQLGADAAAAAVDLCAATFNVTSENSLVKTRVRVAKIIYIPSPWKQFTMAELGMADEERLFYGMAIWNQRKGGFSDFDTQLKQSGADFGFYISAQIDDITKARLGGIATSEYTIDSNNNLTSITNSRGGAYYSLRFGIVFTHEFGHMLLCNHQREMAEQGLGGNAFLVPSRDYNYGYMLKDAAKELGVFTQGTVMCGNGEHPLYYWSNPNLTWTDSNNATFALGLPIGNPRAAYDALWVDWVATFAQSLNTSRPASYNQGHFIALSTRGFIGNSDNAMIGGFVVDGTTPKKIMIRARGPSLTADGVTGVCNNPMMTIYNPRNPIAANTDWTVAPNAAEMASSIYKPTSLVEPGLILTLAPGLYTAIIQPQDTLEGVGIVEVYEMADNSITKMLDVSTRALVKSGNDALFAGFIIDCPAGQKKSVLIRGIGPSMTTQGVSNALQDPTLKVYDMNTGKPVQIGASDDWASEPTYIRVVNQPYVPSSPREAATVLDLPAGIYSVMLEPKDGKPGVGMVEVYEMPDYTPNALISLAPGS